MHLAGLPLATLLTLGAVFGTLIVGLYILKLRRRPVAVPFSRIWQQVLRDKEATSLFSQLKRLLSLLLQLALVALLLLALGDPRTKQNLVEGRNLVVLVDASASMKATDVAPTRLDVAKREVTRMIEGLGGSDRMLIAQMDASIRPLSTMTNEVADLKQGLDQVAASDTRADFLRALSFGLDSLRGLGKAEIVVVSDGALGDLERINRQLDLSKVKLSYVKVGKSARNVAITEFSVRRYPLDKSRYEVMLELTNTNDNPVKTELTLLGDGNIVDVTELSLKPKESLQRFYKDLAGASRTLEATIKMTDGKPDELPADNHVYALMPERRRARVLVVTAGNTYLEAALLLDEYLDVEVIAPEKYPPEEKFDVTIYDSVAPPHDPRTGPALYLAPPAQGSPVELGRPIDMFGFDTWDKKSPLLRWMEMGDIQVAKGHAFKPSKEQKVVGQSDLGPIMVSGSRSGQSYVALSFDPRDSDFVLRVGWPLFILNTVNAFVEEDSSYISSFKTGEVWRVPAPSTTDVATLTEPGGKRRAVPVKEGRAFYLGEHAGFYQLEAPDAPSIRFAANLSDIEESHIEPAAKLEIGKVKAGSLGEFKVGVRREIWLYLLLAVIGVSLIEWLTYHRRWTV
ncbi:MAG TPA: VWA domain-containing protein [Polyangiaceae bacterium]|nr:VWA domain-containing protein [Polyangiaceae bacterium]